MRSGDLVLLLHTGESAKVLQVEPNGSLLVEVDDSKILIVESTAVETLSEDADDQELHDEWCSTFLLLAESDKGTAHDARRTRREIRHHPVRYFS